MLSLQPCPALHRQGRQCLKSHLPADGAVLLFRCGSCNSGVLKIAPEHFDWPTNL
jgi:hypothetical protein